MIRAISIGVAVIFSCSKFLLHKQTQAKGPLCLLMDDDRPLGLATAIAIPLLNKLASKIGVAYMPALVFLIVIIVALSLLVHTTTVLSKHQEIIKILVQENAYMNKEIKDLKAKVEQQERQVFWRNERELNYEHCERWTYFAEYGFIGIGTVSMESGIGP
ncbi:DUF2304 domain-containing protein [Paenibacillus larvae]|nr:DUF2304 domain-containing protein [Paenibacillus larvae]MDT2286957.1 DUF2304 domain-containing protein [Paenibacillus larvae]